MQRVPVVVLNLLIINVLVFLAHALLQNRIEGLEGWLALYKSDLLFPRYNAVLGGDFKPVQLVTHFFMHGGITHIFFNMFALYSLGTPVEQVIGPRRFLEFYLFSGVVGGIMIAFLDPTPHPVVGASGAISGVIVAFAYLYPKARVGIIFLPFISFEVWKFATFFFLLSLGFVLYSYTNPFAGMGGISHFGHLAGMVAALMYIYGRRYWVRFFNNRS